MSAKKYSLGIVGRKAGMSRMFTEDGKSIPVTLIEATPNRITQVKTVETDGYSAVQVTAGVKRASLLNKPATGHLAKAKVEAGHGLSNCASKPTRSAAMKWAKIKADIFTKAIVDVRVTKGKGWARSSAGTKRQRHPRTRCRIAHQAPSASGDARSRVPRDLQATGNVTQTTQNLQVVKVDAERA